MRTTRDAIQKIFSHRQQGNGDEITWTMEHDTEKHIHPEETRKLHMENKDKSDKMSHCVPDGSSIRACSEGTGTNEPNNRANEGTDAWNQWASSRKTAAPTSETRRKPLYAADQGESFVCRR